MRKISKFLNIILNMQVAHVNRGFQRERISNPISNFRNEHAYGARTRAFCRKRQKSIVFILSTTFFWVKEFKYEVQMAVSVRVARASEF